MKYKKYILSILIPFLFMYMVGCAVYLSFDLSDWSFKARVLLTCFASIISIYLLIHNYAIEASKK